LLQRCLTATLNRVFLQFFRGTAGLMPFDRADQRYLAIFSTFTADIPEHGIAHGATIDQGSPAG
jgi:hypothetical protein